MEKEKQNQKPKTRYTAAIIFFLSIIGVIVYCALTAEGGFVPKFGHNSVVDGELKPADDQ